MREERDWLRVVAAVYAAGADIWTEGGVTVHRVAGGFNNALYRVESAGQSCACKLCVADECRRAAREYAALRLLQEAGLDIAPQPLWLDESCTIVPFPAVAYRWLPGQPLSPPPTAQQLASLLDSFQRLHALQPGDFEDYGIRDAWAHWFDFEPYLAELRDFLARYGPWLVATDPHGQDLRDRLARLVDDCTEVVRTADVNPGRESVPLRLCRADNNLANTVWSEDGRLRWVDWEYSGWGDPALELAALRWHGSSVEMSEAQHAWLRDNYRRPAGDYGFEERLAMWDRLRATRWPFLILRWLWSEHHGPDRVRLTRPAADPAELRTRLVRFIERAERFASGGR
jgi:aminoglycoside phosphotransferase (APT) family kinase protein